MSDNNEITPPDAAADADADVLTLMDNDRANMVNQYYTLIDIIRDLLVQMPKAQLTQEQFDYLINGIQKQIKINKEMMNYIMAKVDIKNNI